MVYPSTLNPIAIDTALISLKNIDLVYSGDGDAPFHALHNIDLDLNNRGCVCAIALVFTHPTVSTQPSANMGVTNAVIAESASVVGV